MNAFKYIILFFIFVLLPSAMFAQIRETVTKRQSEQIGKNIYITSTKDTTLVVNPLSQGLNNEHTKFLKSGPILDSLFSDPISTYPTLESAALDIDRLLREVEAEQRISKGNNDALSFKISNKNRRIRKKEMEAKEIAEELVKKDRSVEELAALYLMFGDKPTYYINGVAVPHTVADQLYPAEIIKKNFRVADTASGNPNGEIWISVTDQALNRIKLPINIAYQQPDEITIYNVGSPMTYDLSTYIKEVERAEREKTKADLKPLPVVRREITPDGKQKDVIISSSQPQTKTKDVIPDQQSQRNDAGTKIISRTVNNEQRTDAASPATRPTTNRRSIPVVRQYTTQPSTVVPAQTSTPLREGDNNKVENNDVKTQQKEGVKEEKKPTPKKSVRAIKERQRNQYQDDIEYLE